MFSLAAVDSKASPASGTDEKSNKYHWNGSIKERVLLPRTQPMEFGDLDLSSHHFILKLGHGKLCGY